MGTVVSFYGWQVASISSAGVVRLSKVDGSRLVTHQQNEKFNLRGAVEICAGLGGTSIGASFVGCQPLAAMDHCDLAIENLRLNKHNRALLGDVGNKESWFELHETIHGEQCGLLVHMLLLRILVHRLSLMLWISPT